MEADRELPRPRRAGERQPRRRCGQSRHPRGHRDAVGLLGTWMPAAARSRRRAAPADRRRGRPPRCRRRPPRRCASICSGRRRPTCTGLASLRAAPLRPGRRRPSMGLVIGIDTGGTFTDMVVLDPSTGAIESLKTSSTPSTPGQAIVNALDEGRGRGERRRAVHARDDRGHERADRADGLPGRVRDDEGLRGHPVHPADQPQGALRPALEEARAARREQAGSASGSTSASTPPAPRSGRSTRPRSERSAARSASRGAEAVAICLLFSYVNTEHEERVKQILAEELPGLADLRLARGRADLARVRALVDDDRGRLPAPAARQLRREPRRRAARRRHDAGVDADEVERRRHALRGRRRRADPDGDVRPGRRDDGDRARRAGARRAERADARHGRHERRRRHPRRRPPAPHDRVRDRVGPAGRGAADRHQVGRRRRRLDRLGRRRRLPAGRTEERGRAAGTDLLRARGHGGHGDRCEPAARPARPGVLPRRADAPRRDAADATRIDGARRADGPRRARARRLDRRDREREHGERDQDGLARARPRPAPVLAPRLRRRRPAARGGRRARARRAEGDRAPVPGRVLRARAPARRHPRRQGVDTGVPLQRRRRGARQPAVQPDHRACDRRAAAGGLRRRARGPPRDQHALLRPELRARGRDRGRGARRGGAASGRSAASTRSTPSATATRSTAR